MIGTLTNLQYSQIKGVYKTLHCILHEVNNDQQPMLS